MITYSWSDRSREFADSLLQWNDDKWVMHVLHNSYHNPLIVKRAAKRVHRAWVKREYKREMTICNIFHIAPD